MPLHHESERSEQSARESDDGMIADTHCPRYQNWYDKQMPDGRVVLQYNINPKNTEGEKK